MADAIIPKENFGDRLWQAIYLMKDNLKEVFAIPVIAVFLLVLLTYLFSNPFIEQNVFSNESTKIVLFSVFNFIITIISVTSIMYSASEIHKGEKLDIMKTLNFSLSYFPRWIAVTVLISLCLAPTVLIPIILSFLISKYIPVLGLLSILLFLVGIIMAIFLGVKIFASYYISISEGLKAIDSIKKSFDITKSRGWRTFGNFIMISFILTIFTFVFTGLISFVLGFIGENVAYGSFGMFLIGLVTLISQIVHKMHMFSLYRTYKIDSKKIIRN